MGYDKSLVRTDLLPQVEELFRLKGQKSDKAKARVKRLRLELNNAGMKWLPFSMNLKKE
jgi:hypothetical protein